MERENRNGKAGGKDVENDREIVVGVAGKWNKKNNCKNCG